MEWFFDGIGTEIIGIIISLLVGAIGGGAVGYRIAIKRTTKQKQRAGNDSEQRQELQITKEENDVHLSKNKTSIKQIQKAGDNAVQVQIGGVNDNR